MTPAERKAKIKQLNTDANKLRCEASELAHACPHKIEIQQPNQKYSDYGYGDYGYAHCEGCDTQFGWYCPDSPDHICHYYTENGKVELIDGTLIDKPANCEHESSDWCIYCGNPDERK